MTNKTETEICENCGKNRNKHNSKWRSYNDACKRFKPKKENKEIGRKEIYSFPESKRFPLDKDNK